MLDADLHYPNQECSAAFHAIQGWHGWEDGSRCICQQCVLLQANGAGSAEL